MVDINFISCSGARDAFLHILIVSRDVEGDSFVIRLFVIHEYNMYNVILIHCGLNKREDQSSSLKYRNSLENIEN